MQKVKNKLYEIVFEADTKAGRIFDAILLVIILISIIVIMLESVSEIRLKYDHALQILEWCITGVFTIEYITRSWLVKKPLQYIMSFYGIIDLLAILPTYLSIFLVGGQSFLVIRALRLVRIFRILKLSEYTSAGKFLVEALWSSREKIGIFFTFVITLTIVIGTIMYLIEGEESGFSDIPTSIYWAVVTLTTVGYGDISPVTGLGKFFSSVVMILGYAIIAVPTGIVTAGLLVKRSVNTQVCSDCLYDRHDDDALYCKRCGTSLDIRIKRE